MTYSPSRNRGRRFRHRLFCGRGRVSAKMETNRNDQFSGSRLRIARTFHGFTQVHVAKELGASNQFVNALEAGRKMPNALMVEALSDVLAFEPGFFFGPPLEEFKDDECYFRRRSKTSISLRLQMCARGTLLAQLISYLKEEFDFFSPDIPSIPVQSADDIERAAERCRMHWGIGLDSPINSMARLLETKGHVPIATFQDHETGEQVDAFSRFGDPPLVVYHDRAASRNRFDLAHECAHLVLHRKETKGDHKRLESEANRFSGALLFPRGVFNRLFPRSMKGIWDALLRLKRDWRISLGAIIRRAYDLQLINAAQYRQFYKYLSMSGWTRHEPGEFENEKPELLSSVVAEMGSTVVARALCWTPSILGKVTGLRFEEPPKMVVPIPGRVVNFARTAREPA